MTEAYFQQDLFYLYDNEPNLVEKTIWLNIAKNVIIDEFGKIIIRNYVISPRVEADGRDIVGKLATYYVKQATFPMYAEVFVMSQFNFLYAHKMLEDLPRLAFHIMFLKKHPDIVLHWRDDTDADAIKTVEGIIHQIFQIPNRIVYGNIRADIVYVPQGSATFRENGVSLLYIAEQYQQYIHTMFTTPPSDTILLLERTHHRQLTSLRDIAQAIRNLTTHEVVILSDKDKPSLNTTMKTFYNAAVIIAPHGSGLANLVFARPGTHVLEVLCPPYIAGQHNPMFLKLAYLLSMKYQGLHGLNGCPDKPLSVDVAYVMHTIKAILENLAWNTNDKT